MKTFGAKQNLKPDKQFEKQEYNNGKHVHIGKPTITNMNNESIFNDQTDLRMIVELVIIARD